MNIFEKIAVFLLRLLGLWGVIAGLQSLVWSAMNHVGVSTKQDYAIGWAVAAGVYLVGGVLLFLFSRRLGRLIAGDLS
jgi:hypothetical protein